MKHINFFNSMKYIGLILILSFFIFHNIILVIIGNAIAIFEINKKNFSLNIDKFKNIYNKHEDYKVLIQEPIDKNEKVINSPESQLSLVESIEEFGFIPSNNN